MTVIDGWYSEARRVDAYHGRLGGVIEPETFVIHTTDCMPGSMPAIVKSWTTTVGNGACANFIIGRNPDDGLVQLAATTRNGAHAGGSKFVNGQWSPWHGWYVAWQGVDHGFRVPRVGDTGANVTIHPNTIAIGIELDCAGYLGRPVGDGVRVVSRRWIHPDTKREVAACDVDVDERGIGWHKVTSYQLDTLAALIDAVRPTMKPVRPGLRVSPNGTYKDNGVSWASTQQADVVGHVTLDPTNKTDPGPFVMDWIRARYGA